MCTSDNQPRTTSRRSIRARSRLRWLLSGGRMSLVMPHLPIFARVLGLSLALSILPAAGVATAQSGDDWPTYHHSADRAGVSAPGSTFSDAQQAWFTGPLDGAV